MFRREKSNTHKTERGRESERHRLLVWKSSGKTRQRICESTKIYSSLVREQLLTVKYERRTEGEAKKMWLENQNTQHMPRLNSLSLKFLLRCAKQVRNQLFQLYLPATLSGSTGIWEEGSSPWYTKSYRVLNHRIIKVGKDH